MTGVITGGLAAVAWRRRPAPGADWFALMMMGTTIYSLGYAFSLASTNLDGIYLGWKLKYVGGLWTPEAFLAFVLAYTGRERWLTRRNLALLFTIPALLILLAWTNDFHHLFWTYFSTTTVDSFVLPDFGRGLANWA